MLFASEIGVLPTVGVNSNTATVNTKNASTTMAMRRRMFIG